MNGYRILKLYSKMPTVGLPFRTRSLKLSFRLSRTDWIKQEVQYIYEPDAPLSRDLKHFCQRKRAQFLLNLVLQAELRNHCVAVAVGLCLVPRQLLPQLSLPIHLLGPKTRKGTLCFICFCRSAYLILFLCSGGKVPVYAISSSTLYLSSHPQASAHRGSSSLDKLVYHSLPFCCFSIIPDASCTFYWPSYIISTDSYTLIPIHVHSMDLLKGSCQNRSTLSGHSAGLNFFFRSAPNG
jgi:hypothetical protein